MVDIVGKVICDSIGDPSPRLTTFQLRYPKFIHGEFMTHRALSRNASSSRAIPVSKNLEEVRSDELRASPVYWGAEQKGMQSGEELTGGALIWTKRAWRDAALQAVGIADSMTSWGVHKSIVNRVLEPFLHINVVATGCEDGWMNFFGLRLDRAAQPEIRVLAESMWAVYNESRPKLLRPGELHLPFVDDKLAGMPFIDDTYGSGVVTNSPTVLIKVSIARCARVSYLSHETSRRSTIEEDLKLHDRLVGSQPLHASPAEHQATPDEWYGRRQPYQAAPSYAWAHPELHGNLPGWVQYRKTLDGEAVAPLPEGYER